MEAFGEHLRRWRHRRALSQLELAGLAGTSSRHLSFLESGRSSPGREMVLRLAAALAVEGPERDRGLEAAGLEPFRRQGVPGAIERPLLAHAVDTLLAGHDPLPALALDTDWRLLGANRGAARLLAVLGAAGTGNETGTGGACGAGGANDADPTARTSVDGGAKEANGTDGAEGVDLAMRASADGDANGADATNRANGVEDAGSGGPSLVDLLIAHADGGVILDWADVADATLRRGRAELTRCSRPSRELLAALERLEAMLGERTGTGANGAAREEDAPAAIVPLRVRAGDVTLSLVTMIAQFGGLDYVEVDAPRVELMLPADDATRRWFDDAG